MNKDDVLTISIIPARGGSKGVPRKNVKKLGKLPLIEYTIMASLLCDDIDLTIVSTEDNEIEDVSIKAAKKYWKSSDDFMIVRRPMDLALDVVQTDDVAHHVCRQLYMDGYKNIKHVVMLQPTSPFRDYTDISDAFSMRRLYKNDGTTISCNSVEHGYFWSVDFENNVCEPLGHNPQKRLGRQWETNAIAKENGAIYIFDFQRFLLERNYRMAPYHMYFMEQGKSLDINTMDDWKKALEIIEGYENVLVRQ